MPAEPAGAGATTTSDRTAAHNSSRTAPASTSVSWAAATIPSIMSATTATAGLPRSITDTVVLPSRSRRIARRTPGERGGLRNAGTSIPWCRAAWPSSRATAANRNDDNSPTGPAAADSESRHLELSAMPLIPATGPTPALAAAPEATTQLLVRSMQSPCDSERRVSRDRVRG